MCLWTMCHKSIPLTDYAPLKKWSCLDSTSAFTSFRRDELADPPAFHFGAARAVRKHHLPGFSNWKNHDAFERAFAPPAFHFGATGRLEKALRTSLL
jgi:hypothetical protein